MLQNCRRRVLNWYKKVYAEGSRLTGREKAVCSIQAVIVAVILSIFFYRSFAAVILMTPVGLYYLTLLTGKKEREKRESLRNEFKEAILSIAANLRAGYAVENAFRETLQELKMLYGAEAAIYREFFKIVQGLANQVSIETLMKQFAERTRIPEVREFADVFAIAKKSAGNLTEIIEEAAETISGKIDVEREVQVLTAAKRLEQNIMSVIPFAIIFYVSVTSAGYFDVLYETPAGRAIMTACFAVYAAAYLLGKKISEIQV